jgi:hypothetical protein
MYNQNNNNQVMGYMCSNTKNVENFQSSTKKTVENFPNFPWSNLPPPMQPPPPPSPPTYFKQAVQNTFGTRSWNSWWR